MDSKLECASWLIRTFNWRFGVMKTYSSITQDFCGVSAQCVYCNEFIFIYSVSILNGFFFKGQDIQADDTEGAGRSG